MDRITSRIGLTLAVSLIVVGIIATALFWAPNAEKKPMADPQEKLRISQATDYTLPDVIVIIIDAARADHLEAYGYDRETTPHMSRLIEESLLFDNVYAQAPYTVCSVPTIMTGLSFVTHGTVGKGNHRLPEHETSLAEYLAAAGYQTVGISSTPKHSTASGANQGYDAFHEVWGRVKKLVLDPAPLVEQGVASIRAAERDRPLFMMFHILPPHAPYVPPENHDLFREPGQLAISDGEQSRFFRSVEKNGEIPTETRLNELRALYDGNLHWADATIASLTKELKETRNWSNTLLAVVSDHGEAFMEHGKLQHSTTLYDEMLRVPLVLRLPGAAQPGWIDTSQLVSLQDLAPTLLGVVGLRWNSRVTGRDLLSRKQGAQRDRIAFRTEGQFPDFGLLDRHWKLIVHPDGSRELYDLNSDPAETHNLSKREASRTSKMAMILADELKNAPQPLGSIEAAPLSEEEREVLRKLGYLE